MNDPSRSRASTTREAAPTTAESKEAAHVALTIAHSPDGAASGSTIPLAGDLVVVGRDVAGGGISIDDGRLSRVHFRIAFDGRAGTHRVGDARSKNGTFVEGRRVDSAVLRTGAVIRAGDTVFVYDDPEPMKPLQDWIRRAAHSDLSVLILGETGAGKERVARAIHDRSGRAGPFLAQNCAAMPGSLLGAELFGHTRGAFSGAVEARRGLFQSADGGTLFLDEIGDATPDLQAVLLRALEEKVIRPIGSDREVSVDTRVVAATHNRLQDSVRAGRFRADLYARLAQVVVSLPSLRERRAEILKLAAEIARENGRSDWYVDVDAAEMLVRHEWPFNVRELETIVRGFIAMGDGSTLDAAYLKLHHPDLSRPLREPSNHPGEVEVKAEASERPALEALLARHGGNVSAVAEELGRPRAQIYRRLKALGLDPSRFRSRI